MSLRSPRTQEQRHLRARVAALASHGVPNDAPELLAARVALVRANRVADNIAAVNALVSAWPSLDAEQRARIGQLIAPPIRQETA